MKSGGGCFLVRNGTADTMVKEFLENVEVRLRKVGYTGCFLLKKYLCKEVCWSERYFNEMDVFGWRAVPPTRWWKIFKKYVEYWVRKFENKILGSFLRIWKFMWIRKFVELKDVLAKWMFSGAVWYREHDGKRIFWICLIGRSECQK